MDFLEFGNIYPSVLNWLTIGFSAVTFILVFKYLSNRYDILPGVAETFASL